MPVIPKIGRLRQDDHEFYISLGYTVKTCQKRKRKEGREGGREGDREGEKEGEKDYLQTFLSKQLKSPFDILVIKKYERFIKCPLYNIQNFYQVTCFCF